jgi:predicted secreted hydrolase
MMHLFSFIKTFFFTLFLIASYALYALPPSSPVLDISINGLEVTASWTKVNEASGYQLFYAPCSNINAINKIEMGTETDYKVRLSTGSGFYIAVQAYNLEGNSPYSNLEQFGCVSMPLQMASADEPNLSSHCGATPQGMIDLPSDEMFHNEPVEWWYWTGHLQTDTGRKFGFEQVVFLVRMLGRTMQMAHHAITDIEDDSFHYLVTTQFADPIPQVAGFNWDIKGLTAKGRSGTDYLHGEVDEYVMDLKLTPTKPAVFQHGNGYTEYHFGGNTYYYSYQRMKAEGSLKVKGQNFNVTGEAWFDHQWGNLIPIINLGWDWFAIQLDDHREIMLFNANTPDKENEGILVGGSFTDAHCQVKEIDAEQIDILPLDKWTSPHTGCTYPQGWTIRVGELNLTLTPVMADQELTGGGRTYWEGAAIVSGDASGRAYIELANYCQ